MSGPRQGKLRLLIADHPATRLGIRIALRGRFQISAEAGTATDAIDLARRARPDVCLVGFELPGGGLVTTREIRALGQDAPIIVVANSANATDLLASIAAGATGYLPGDISGPALARAINAVAAGGAAVPRSMVIELVRALQTKAAPGHEVLTTREAQVVFMRERGHPTAAIAECLGISPVTVRRHISSSVRKTSVVDRRRRPGAAQDQLSPAAETTR